MRVNIVKELRCCFFIIVLFLASCSSQTTTPKAKVTPKSSAAMFNAIIGISYLEQGDSALANQKIKSAYKALPDSAFILSAMGLLEANNQNYDKAKEFYQKALKIEPQSGSIHNNYGTLLCDRGEYEKANKQFMLAISSPKYSQVGSAYENAGLCSESAGNDDKAIFYFRTALTYNSDSERALFQLAKINFGKGDNQTAWYYLSHYNRIAKKETPEALLLQAKIARKLHDGLSEEKAVTRLRLKYPQSEQFAEIQNKKRA